jgi:hypothetical protein
MNGEKLWLMFIDDTKGSAGYSFKERRVTRGIRTVTTKTAVGIEAVKSVQTHGKRS